MKQKIPDHLQHLPSDLLTTDRDDPDRVYPTDAPHIVDAIAQDTAEALHKADTTPAKKKVPGVGEVVPLTKLGADKAQFEVDLVRLRVIKTLIDRYIGEVKALTEPKIRPKHLWFPEDNLSHYELRDGNAPSDNYRPKWMRRLRLEIDIHTIPKGLQGLLQKEKVANARD